MVSDAIRANLENRYKPMPAEALPEADAIVLLGGGLESQPLGWPYPNLQQGADRIWHAARLYHAGKAPIIIVSGGNYGWQSQRRSNAAETAELLQQLDVPEQAIIEESKSLNTYQNATETVQIARNQGFHTLLLVTSALHMRRAEAAFNAAGLDSIAAPTDFEVIPEPVNVLRWLQDGCRGAGRQHQSHQGVSRLLDVPAKRLGYGGKRMSGCTQVRLLSAAHHFTETV